MTWQLYDAFETKADALRAARDAVAYPFRGQSQAMVRPIPPQGGGRLKWGVFVR